MRPLPAGILQDSAGVLSFLSVFPQKDLYLAKHAICVLPKHYFGHKIMLRYTSCSFSMFTVAKVVNYYEENKHGDKKWQCGKAERSQMVHEFLINDNYMGNYMGIIC